MGRTSAWIEAAERNNWSMPMASAGWKTLPLIRHVRAIYFKVQIERWYSAMPGIRTGYDDWVVDGIWMGKESWKGKSHD